MTDASTHDLVQRVRALLDPGEIELAGVIIHTDYGNEDEIELYEVTLEVGDIVAEAAGINDWYVYSGNDDPKFASNVHQGLGLSDDEFVWECQHLLREGQFVIVMYYRAKSHERVVSVLTEKGHDITGVRPSDSESLSNPLDDTSPNSR